MGKIDSSIIGERLFYSLPRIYQQADRGQKHQLERYLKALADAGFSVASDETTGLLDLNDPGKTPYNALMVLFEQYGLPMFYGVPEAYLRKLLPIIGDLYSRKGSISAIEYITGIISDVKVEIELDEDFYNNFKVNLVLDMTYDKKDKRDFPTEEQLVRIINEFTPFFFDVTVVILADYYEDISIGVSDIYSVEMDNYSGLFLDDTTNQENKLTNKTVYTNEGNFEKFVYTDFVEYAKDEIYINGTLDETIEY